MTNPWLNRPDLLLNNRFAEYESATAAIDEANAIPRMMAKIVNWFPQGTTRQTFCNKRSVGRLVRKAADQFADHSHPGAGTKHAALRFEMFNHLRQRGFAPDPAIQPTTFFGRLALALLQRFEPECCDKLEDQARELEAERQLVKYLLAKTSAYQVLIEEMTDIADHRKEAA